MPVDKPLTREECTKLIASCRCDVTTILGTLGPLAMFAHAFGGLAEHAQHLVLIDGPIPETMRLVGSDQLLRWAKVLGKIRSLLGEAMEYAGDVQNGCDAHTDTDIAVSTPVYDLLRKRSKGETWDE